jgi:hypothetical protein
VKIKGKKTDPDRFAESETLTLVPSLAGAICRQKLTESASRSSTRVGVPGPEKPHTMPLWHCQECP